MSRQAQFEPYRPKTILNKSKRADHWFWSRYSAYPYKGCQHGCEFCYCREQKFSPYDDPEDFAYRIQPKENAPELLRRALLRAPIDVISTGDYQPAERIFNLSRKLLEVCYELGFPVFVLERSPLVLRDLDLLKAIHEKARLVVVFSAITAPGSAEYERICQMERLAPPAEKRFAAMEQIAAAGIPTGACMMPLLPGLCDTPENLENVVRHTAEHGGSFVLAGGLTLSDQQRSYFFEVLTERFHDLLELYKQRYPGGSYSPAGWDWPGIALQIKEYCHQYGILDRMPRPVIPGEKRAANKRIVEALANQTYDMEIQGAPGPRVWAIRKAAWAIEDLEQDIRLIYQQMGVKGLQSIPNVGPRLAGQVEALIKTLLK